MAVRFDASGDFLRRNAANIVTNGDTWTFCCWAKLKVDNGQFKTIFYGTATGDGEGWLETGEGASPGTPDNLSKTLHLFDLDAGTESDLTGPIMTIDTWYFFCFRRTSDTSRDLYYGTEAGGTLTKLSDTASRAWSGDLDDLWLGNDIYTEPFNGEIAYARLWSSSLSDADVDAEWRSTTPVMATNLRGDWRLATAATAATDSSGNSLTLTVGGTLSDGGANPTPPALGAAPAVPPHVMRFSGRSSVFRGPDSKRRMS